MTPLATIRCALLAARHAPAACARQAKHPDAVLARIRHAALLELVAQAEAACDELAALLLEAASAGLEYDDARLDYVVLQMDRDAWQAMRTMAGLAAAPADKEGRV